MRVGEAGTLELAMGNHVGAFLRQRETSSGDRGPARVADIGGWGRLDCGVVLEAESDDR